MTPEKSRVAMQVMSLLSGDVGTLSRVRFVRELAESDLTLSSITMLDAADLAEWYFGGSPAPGCVNSWPGKVSNKVDYSSLPYGGYIRTGDGWTAPISFTETKSTFITWAQWHPERQLLRICLKGHTSEKGAQVREYGSVPKETIMALGTSKSPGSCYNDRIRDRLPSRLLVREDDATDEQV